MINLRNVDLPAPFGPSRPVIPDGTVTVTSFNPDLLDPGPGFAVFCVETALLLGLATTRFVRRDA